MASERKHITRTRISYSCQKCRLRKVKCDKVHPACGSCQKTGEECLYTFSENDVQPNGESHTTQTQHGRKRKLPSKEPSPGRESQREATHPDLQKQLNQLSALLDQFSNVAGINAGQLAESSDPARHGETAHIPTPESQQSYDDTQAQSTNGGKVQSQHTPLQLAVDGRHVEHPSIDTISAQMERLTSLMRISQTSQTEHDANAEHNRDSVPRRPAPDSKGDGTLFVPNENQRNALFRSWLYSVYPVLPIVDPTAALLHYRAFHFWYKHGLEKGTPNPVEEYVPLIYAIYHAGMASMSLRGIRRWFPGRTRRACLETARQQFFTSLRAPTRVLTNPPVLAARVMMCYLSTQDETDVGLTSTVAPLARTAYSCNLHRERPNGILDRHMAEVRRRLWWETVNLDTVEATANSTPPSINHHYSDARMFCEIKDRKLNTSEANAYESALSEGRLPDTADDPISSTRSSAISAIYLVMRGRTLITSCARRLLDINLAAKTKTKDDMTEVRKILSEAHSDVRAIIERIPTKGIPEQDFTPTPTKPGQSLSFDHSTDFGEDLMSNEIEAMCGSLNHFEDLHMSLVLWSRHCLVAFHKWARIYLSMLIDQSHCYSFAPFLSNTKRKLWIVARQCALRHAHSCLRKFNTLAADMELERFRWAWPGMSQPLHACIIILLDLYEDPRSPEAARSRELIDEMLALSAPECGIVGGEDGSSNLRPLQEGGDEAFAMLMQLRAKSWQKAGLDPGVLWTEQDQIDVGVARTPTNGEKLRRSMREDTVLNTSLQGNPNHPENSHYRAMISERTREVFHPSEVGPPENETERPSDPLTHSFHNTTDSTDHSNGRNFLRARRNQQRLPFAFHPHRPRSKQPDQVYQFKPPSERFDIDHLIKKIKSMRKAKEDGQAENLYQQITTANHDLTNLLAQKVAETSGFADRVILNGEDDGAWPQTQRNHQHQHQNWLPTTTAGPYNLLPDTEADSLPRPTLNNDHQNLPYPSTSNDNNYNIHQHPTTSSLLPPIDTFTSTIPTTVAAEMIEPTLPSATDTATNTTAQRDVIEMDFDWVKWDEIFGGIMEGNIDGGIEGNGGDGDGDGGVETIHLWDHPPVKL